MLCDLSAVLNWGLRDYGVAGQLGLERTAEEYVAAMVGVFREVRRVLRTDGTLWLCLGDCYVDGGRGSDAGSTLEGTRHNQTETRRVRVRETARRDRASVMPMAPTASSLPRKNLVGQPWRVALALQADGWWLREDVIWHKRNGMPESVRDRCTRSHEYLFRLTKSERYFFRQLREPYRYGRDHHRNADIPPVSHVPGAPIHTGLRRSGNVERKHGEAVQRNGSPQVRSVPWTQGQGRNLRSVWSFSIIPFAGAHFATFPPKLPRRCIRLSSRPGDVVLDPFAGVGTTLLVANRLGRHSIGIELNPTYAAMAERRIREDAPLLADVEIA